MRKPACGLWNQQKYTGLISAKAFVKSNEQKIAPVRVLNLPDHKKVISKNTDVDECAPIEAVINNEQPQKPAEMSEKDQKEFGENVEKWVAGLAAPNHTNQP